MTTTSSRLHLLLVLVLWIQQTAFGSRYFPLEMPKNSGIPAGGSSGSYNYQQCYYIPSNMTLCQQVGYGQMILPNFLQHESLREAIQQSNFWVVLANTNCHADLRRFLCSLYAPVCVKGHQEVMVMPCHNLCTTVKSACLPRMMSFGYHWPAIVDCEQFPKESHMCIPLSSPQADMGNKCEVCEKKPTYENIVSSSCLANVGGSLIPIFVYDFDKIFKIPSVCKSSAVMKVKINNIQAASMGADGYDIITSGRRKIFKGPTTNWSSMQGPTVPMRTSCLCDGSNSDSMNYRQGRWLVMGVLSSDRHLKITFMTQWQRKDKQFRQFARSLRKGINICRRDAFALNDDGAAQMQFDSQPQREAMADGSDWNKEQSPSSEYNSRGYYGGMNEYEKWPRNEVPPQQQQQQPQQAHQNIENKPARAGKKKKPRNGKKKNRLVESDQHQQSQYYGPYPSYT